MVNNTTHVLVQSQEPKIEDVATLCGVMTSGSMYVLLLDCQHLKVLIRDLQHVQVILRDLPEGALEADDDFGVAHIELKFLTDFYKDTGLQSKRRCY
ncbi:hypothetical protein Tco_1373441 [Tanacetum coccineum]